MFRGTRVPVSAIFENLKTSPIEEVLENFHVTREQVQTCSISPLTARWKLRVSGEDHPFWEKWPMTANAESLQAYWMSSALFRRSFRFVDSLCV